MYFKKAVNTSAYTTLIGVSGSSGSLVAEKERVDTVKFCLYGTQGNGERLNKFKFLRRDNCQFLQTSNSTTLWESQKKFPVKKI